MGGKLGSLLLSWAASGLVQGRVRDGVSVKGGVQLDAQLELLDGRDAARMQVGVVLGKRPRSTRQRSALGHRTAGQPPRGLSPPQNTQKYNWFGHFGQKMLQQIRHGVSGE